ncbi:MAG: class I SAM-dependent methyltransferase [Rhodospirillaceae bacterium]|nr:class I SAM-dependent methyltransferase [Rhodospirillaceae bacterium]MBT5944967.1 class I SAM-dependent methyltransferase [Rhodospirillaceae bacterium]MBT6403585.1 class I SAM-dependent methyltransferase [Rhodospirillaceae bacterium]MBT6535459.1 class I SAM-dependent methyltransferase [Rhodospirillaceae bacterium]MBT7361813.1 class I SAM-dependent methyltransferase [Rhodospirillaceae bacterium]
MSQITAHFDREAADYPTDIGTDYIQARKWALIDAHAPVTGRVADIGAANGRHTLAIAERPLDIVAIDPSQQMLARLTRLADARNQVGTILPCAAALPTLPMTGATFDLIYCFSTLLLLSPKDQEAALAEMAGLLRPGGSVIVDIAGSRSLAIRYWRRHYRRRDLGGVFGHSAPRTRGMLEQNGLEIISMEAHGVLSQFLLAPGLQRFPGLIRRVRGSETKPGWDATISRRLPALAERWYIVARRPDGTA